MRAYLIDPTEKTVVEIDYDGDFRSIYTLIEAELFAAVFLNTNQDCVYIDDEGLLKPNTFFQIQGYPNPLAGKGLVLGTNAEGESIEPSLNLSWLRLNVSFPNNQHVVDAAKSGAFDCTVTTFERDKSVTKLLNKVTPQFSD